jgi:hypothetical protein
MVLKEILQNTMATVVMDVSSLLLQCFGQSLRRQVTRLSLVFCSEGEGVYVIRQSYVRGRRHNGRNKKRKHITNVHYFFYYYF